MSLIARFFTVPESSSFFLFGPRGTGKTTWMKLLFQNAQWFDLLDPELERTLIARPERLSDFIDANPNQKTIVIDEVQKVPTILSIVHKMIERKQGWQFVLTGSSARKLKRSGADLLGGRALNKMLYPFMAAELKGLFSLENSLHFGMLPLLLEKPSPIESLQAYISLYLHEEVQMEGLVRNLDDFSRFLEAISFSHAAQLNITNVARECEVKRKTVENYIHILEDLLLAYQLPVFTKRAQRELSKSPKFYLFDTGVFRTLRPKGPFDRSEEINGAALEGLVAQHLMAWNEYSTQKHQISFWRTRTGLEVDFIIYGSSGLYAIEVKHSNKISISDTKSLNAFISDYPTAKAILLYRGDKRVMEKNVLCIPCEQFLLDLIPNQPIPL